MPCYDPGPHPSESDRPILRLANYLEMIRSRAGIAISREANMIAKFGGYMTKFGEIYQDAFTAELCAALRSLSDKQMAAVAADTLYGADLMKWWATHQVQDAEREAWEAGERERIAMVEGVMAKLEPAERAAMQPALETRRFVWKKG